MNVHHLELFYYVARHGGIMEAVRNIPYGIQQPAVSSQVAQLEADLGVILFHRRPFALTPQGKKLYQFIEPFFANLEQVAGELQGGRVRHFRIGASAIILRDHLPALLQGVTKKFPGLRLSLRDGYPVQLEEMLLRDEIDLVLTVIEKKAAPGIHSLPLLELPSVLLVPRDSPYAAAKELWKLDKIEAPLICLPKSEVLCRGFQQKLNQLGVDWFPSIEASSADLVEAYVAAGLGIGLSVAIPKKLPHPNVRVLPLDGFAPIVIGALWRGRTTPLLQAFLEETKRRAKELA